VAGMKKPNDHA